jgi:uncharacterized linocin/CFP29 family protein
MNNLFRELAPIPKPAWDEIEKEATRTLKTMLAARRVVDFVGPKGFDLSSVGTGRADPIEAPPSCSIQARLREVQPLVEFTAPFEVLRSEIDAIDRGAKDPDLDSVIAAARQIAIAENAAVFHGYPAAHIRGMGQVEKGAKGLSIGDDYGTYPAAITSAVNRLRDGGVEGPYAVVLSESGYANLLKTTKDGYPVLEHVRRIVDGPLVWAPGLEGALVASLRGGDFELTVGRDFSIGYLDHDEEVVRLYIEESFTFRLLSPQAAMPLAYAGKKKDR